MPVAAVQSPLLLPLCSMPYVPSTPERFYIAEPDRLVSMPSSRFENVREGIDGIVPLTYAVWVKHMNERFAFSTNSILARTKLCFPQIVVLRKNSGGQRRCHWFVRFGLITPSINIHERIGTSFLFELSAQSATRVLDSCVAAGGAFDQSIPFTSPHHWLASGHVFAPPTGQSVLPSRSCPSTWIVSLRWLSGQPSSAMLCHSGYQRVCSPVPSPCLTDASTPLSKLAPSSGRARFGELSPGCAAD